MQTSQRDLTLTEALLPVAVMALLTAAVLIFADLTADMLVVILLAAATVAGWIAARQGAGWDAMQRAAGERLASVLPALLILLAIGALIGTWMLAGTIPFLVYWGVQLIRPEYLALTAFLATAAMSLFTGTSWGSAGTIGVALMGTALALNAPLGITAGAVVSGAYLGDKLSPLSDTTNICAIGADVPLFTHIRHLLFTAVPSFLLSVAVFYAVALSGDGRGEGGGSGVSHPIVRELGEAFTLSWVVVLPALVVIVGIARRMAPVLAIMISALAAAVIGVLVQGFSMGDALLAGVSGFRVGMFEGRVGEVGSDFLRLVERGGMYSMAATLVVVIAAFVLAAGMHVSGALEKIIAALLSKVRSVFGLIASTMLAGATMIGLTSHGGVTALVIGGLFQDAYRSSGVALQNLSRSLEDSVTVVEPLMPWTVSAVFMATTLGVPTVEYAIWAPFCYGGPIFSLTLAALARRWGFGVYPGRFRNRG